MSNTNNLILVTGGAGYIGSVLVGQLLAKNYIVRVIDNLMYHQKSLDIYHGSSLLEIIDGDIRNSGDIDRALKNVDAVAHLAAIVGDPACEKNPELAEEVNQSASEQLFRKATEQNVKQFIFASTCSNYGRMDDPNNLVTENSPLKPISHYARLKVGFEKYLLEKNPNDMYSVILRFATAFGMSPRPRFDLTVNEFTATLAMGKKLEVYGEQFWRPYCHTQDLARACILAIESDESKLSGRAFNVGDTSENFQKKTLVDMIFKELPDTAELVSYVKKDEDPRDYKVSFELIKNKLGFTKSKTVTNGIREFIEAIKTGQIKNLDDPVYKN